MEGRRVSLTQEEEMTINGLTLLLVLGAAWLAYEMFKVWQEIEELYSDDDL